MKEEEIKFIESCLKLELPKFYRRFLLNYPEDLKIIGKTVFRNDSDFPPLSYSPTLLIELNDIQWDHKGWFIIGDADCCNYYFISTDEDDQCVYFWDHDADEFYDETKEITWEAGLELIAESLDEFVQQMIYEHVIQKKNSIN